MVIYWIACYLIGTILTAWWVGKWRGTDLRQERSGNLGARNAGAVLGKTAFFITFLGDASKAALAVWLGRCLDFSPWAVAFGGFAVVAGHLFPFWLKGRGGKGIAAFIGASLFIAPKLFLVMAIGFAAALLLIRSATLAMLAGLAAFAVFIIHSGEFPAAWPLLAAMALILRKHVPDIKESFHNRFGQS